LGRPVDVFDVTNNIGQWDRSKLSAISRVISVVAKNEHMTLRYRCVKVTPCASAIGSVSVGYQITTARVYFHSDMPWHLIAKKL
jgi:hypothetical protein